MARMHTRRHGQSGSDKPPTDEPPEWSDVDADVIEERVVELAEQGHDPSQIGMKLRDEGVKGTPVPDIKLATGKKVTEILEENDAGSDLPEDLRNLMERAVRLREHMEENPQDYQNKRALQNTESKVRRLVNYYRGNELPEDFEYSYQTATAVLEDPTQLKTVTTVSVSPTTADESGTTTTSSDSGTPPARVNATTASSDDSSTEDALPTGVLQPMRSLQLTNGDGQLVKGPLPTSDQQFTYERFTTDNSAIYWPSTLGILTFLSRVRKLPGITDNTQCELILIPSDHPSHDPIELSLDAVTDQPKLEDRCQFLAAITDDYEITWERRPSQSGDYCAEIVILIKSHDINFHHILSYLFDTDVPTPEGHQSLADLITTLHQTDREELLKHA